ncbi:MAG: hypothetical protein H6Q33_174 [Deltaproteobacteria bacterium]|nr:hypothetical protein [Deltaproteobacteria bacterium]
MMPRRLLQIVGGLATLVGPLATVAYAEFIGTVTTAPYVPAPAMSIPMMVLLGVMLAGGGAHLLRRTRAGAVGKVALVAALTALAGLAYANGNTITIKDADCGKQTVSPFDPGAPQYLQSNCPNPIRIISIEFTCEDPPSLNPCTEGQVLNNGDICALPECRPA